MRRIHLAAAPVKPLKVVAYFDTIENIVASCDTVELFVYKPPIGMRRMLERAQQGEIETRKVYVHGRYVGTIFAVNHPKPSVLPVLDWLVENVPFCTRHRVDIAVDWHALTAADESHIFETLDRNGTLKWMSPQATKKWVSEGEKNKKRARQGDGRFPWSVYFGQEMSSRVAVLYQKRTQVIRLELRFQGARSVQRLMNWLGANTFEDMVSLNPRDLFDHHFRLVRCKEGYVTKAVQSTVKQDLLRHLSKQSRRSESVFGDRYRSRIAGRVRWMYSNMDMFGFKRRVRNPSRLIEGLDADWWDIPTRLKWPDLRGGVIENTHVFQKSVAQRGVITPTPSQNPSRGFH